MVQNITKICYNIYVNIYMEGDISMERWVCEPCGYVYDPEVGDPDGGVAPGTKFEDIPEDWVCPVCGATKDMFAKED